MKRICELKEFDEELMGRLKLKEIQEARNTSDFSFFFFSAMFAACRSSQPRDQT